MFINAYNFIRLSDKPNRQSLDQCDQAEEEKYTGAITYTLETKSRLFIPNTSSEKAFSLSDDPEHKEYDFFSYRMLEAEKDYTDDCAEPVIPGSEVRGMIRTIYETLSNSCLPVLDGKTALTKRTVEHFKPGILMREGERIMLYEAEDLIYRDREDFSQKYHVLCTIPDGSQVYFLAKRFGTGNYVKRDVLKLQTQVNREWKTGYLMKGAEGPDIAPPKPQKRPDKTKCNVQKCANFRNGTCPGYRGDIGSQPCHLAVKHCAHVFMKNPEARNGRGNSAIGMIDNITQEELGLIIKMYLDERPESYKEYQQAYQQFMDKEKDALPVYYSKFQIGRSTRIMLSPACITREVYRTTVSDMVRAYNKCGEDTKGGDGRNLVSKNEICPACRLFGIVSNGVTRGSKIRFTDMTLADRAPYEAEKFKGCYGDEEGKYENALLTLDELASPKLSNTAFYLQKPVDPEGEVWFWTYDYYTVKKRNGQVIVKQYDGSGPQISGRKFYWNHLSKVQNCQEMNKRNKTVRTVKPGVCFTGKLYFDGITEAQLQQLLYILEFTSDGTHGFKLGTGKPLGLGSVELKVKGVQVRELVDGKYRHTAYPKTNDRNQPEYPFKRLYQSRDDEGTRSADRVQQAFERITRYLPENKTICYPFTRESLHTGEGFKWFMENTEYYSLERRTEDIVTDQTTDSPKTRLQTKIKASLPGIMDGNLPEMR